MSDTTPTTEIVNGDALAVLGEMEKNSVHAIVTDPPYGLGFMGNSWDQFDSLEYQQWCKRWSEKAMRALKPGGHMLAFSGSRTYHRLASGVEDAGFDYRDVIMWTYGTGFPKGLALDKELDKKAGKEGEYGAPKTNRDANELDNLDREMSMDDGYHRPWMDDPDAKEKNARTYIPSTELAKQFRGAKTSLKPALEPIAVARNPIEEDTIAEQVMVSGTGGLNIDECRIATEDTWERNWTDNEVGSWDGDVYGQGESANTSMSEKGRYPANLVLDGEAAKMIDEQSGYSSSNDSVRHNSEKKHNESVYGDASEGGWVTSGFSDSGGASRFFYTAKASKSERTADGEVECDHPTVKPVDLMEWLVKLVTAEGQKVLDPFMGSGTTLMACYNTGRDGIGIERDEEYIEIAENRIEANGENPEMIGSYPEHIENDPLDF